MNPSNEELFELLKDPIRSRIMFEFMLDQRITINKLTQLIGKDRTTINYHIKMFLEAGIIHEVDKIKHSRGKPTIVYSLKESNYKIEKTISGDPIDQVTSSLIDQAKDLNMIAAISEQSHDVLKFKDSSEDNFDRYVIEHHMLLMDQKDVSEFYQGLYDYISNFQNKLDANNSDQLSEKNSGQKHLVYTGAFPIIRDTETLEETE